MKIFLNVLFILNWIVLARSQLFAADPILHQINLECYYVHGDRLQSAKVLTNEEGLKQHYEYKAFGNERFVLDTENFVSSRRFTDQVYDEDTGLYYYGARYYDPLIGRFLQADPVIAEPADPQYFNSYAYVLNNPMRHIDPSGNIPEKVIPISETIELSTAQEFFVWLGSVGQELRNFSDGLDGRMDQVSSVSLSGGVDLLDFPAAQSTGFNTAREALKSVTEIPRAFGNVLNDQEVSLKDRFTVATTLVGVGVTARSSVYGVNSVIRRSRSAARGGFNRLLDSDLGERFKKIVRDRFSKDKEIDVYSPYTPSYTSSNRVNEILKRPSGVLKSKEELEREFDLIWVEGEERGLSILRERRLMEMELDYDSAFDPTKTVLPKHN